MRTESTTKQHDDITSAVLDFLESQQENYEDDNGVLPDDWHTSIFKEEEVMVTDEMMDAIDMLIEICSNEEQVRGMKSVREMLLEFDEQEWLNMERPSDWLEQFLSCRRNTEQEIKQHKIDYARLLWKEFGYIPMDPETECIEETWYCFPAGTYREDIWHWFEATFDVSVGADLMRV